MDADKDYLEPCDVVSRRLDAVAYFLRAGPPDAEPAWASQATLPRLAYWNRELAKLRRVEALSEPFTAMQNMTRRSIETQSVIFHQDTLPQVLKTLSFDLNIPPLHLQLAGMVHVHDGAVKYFNTLAAASAPDPPKNSILLESARNLDQQVVSLRAAIRLKMREQRVDYSRIELREMYGRDWFVVQWRLDAIAQRGLATEQITHERTSLLALLAEFLELEDFNNPKPKEWLEFLDRLEALERESDVEARSREAYPLDRPGAAGTMNTLNDLPNDSPFLAQPGVRGELSEAQALSARFANNVPVERLNIADLAAFNVFNVRANALKDAFATHHREHVEQIQQQWAASRSQRRLAPASGRGRGRGRGGSERSLDAFSPGERHTSRARVLDNF